MTHGILVGISGNVFESPPDPEGPSSAPLSEKSKNLASSSQELRPGIFENSQTQWKFKAGKSTSRLKYVRNQQIPHLTMHWITEVEMAKSIDELMTSRSIVWRNDFTDYDNA